MACIPPRWIEEARYDGIEMLATGGGRQIAIAMGCGLARACRSVWKVWRAQERSSMEATKNTKNTENTEDMV